MAQNNKTPTKKVLFYSLSLDDILPGGQHLGFLANWTFNKATDYGAVVKFEWCRAELA